MHTIIQINRMGHWALGMGEEGERCGGCVVRVGRVVPSPTPATILSPPTPPHAQCPTAASNAQCPMPNAQCPMPNSQFPIPKVNMTLIDFVGFLAALLTTIAFLPQVLKTWRSKSAKDVSLEMLILFCTGVFLWIVYGLYIQAIPIVLANVVVLMLNLTILFLKLKYK